MCNEFKSKKDIVFFRFALGFSNRNLTETYTELELKNSATYSLEGHAQNDLWNNESRLRFNPRSITIYAFLRIYFCCCFEVHFILWNTLR